MVDLEFEEGVLGALTRVLPPSEETEGIEQKGVRSLVRL